MALVIDDRVKETSTTTGTGTYTLAGAVTGFQSFAAIGDGNTTWYMATDNTDWETGIGTYTSSGTTLARTTVIASSNADAAVNWAAGTRTLVCTMPSSKAFVGPASASDNAIVRYDGTDGRTVQDSQFLIDDVGNTTLWGSGSKYDIYRGTNDASGAYVNFLKTRNASPFGHTVVQSGDFLGGHQYYGNDGDQFIAAAEIQALVDGTPGNNDMPGRLGFFTAADASATLTERLRINNAGAWGLSGATYGSAGDRLTSNGSALPPTWSPSPIRGHIWGLTMSNAADTVNDITVAAGAATDESHAYVMVLAAGITKRLDATWAVGTAQGGLNTGGEANSTWYEVHLIRRSDTGVVDVMFTTTANRATLPANYDQQRRIGWIRNDGSGNILQFTQVDDHFTLTTQVNDVSASPTATAAAVALTAPPSSIARFRASATSSASVNTAQVTVFSEIVEGNVTPNDTTGIASLGYNDIVGASAGHFELRVSSTSTIEHDSDAAVSTFDISTFGWIDHRMRMSAT